jgi:hypothetical protein
LNSQLQKISIIATVLMNINTWNRLWQPFTKSFQPIVIIYLLVALIASFQNWLLPLKEMNGGYYTQYNNYVIFKLSFFHLLNNQNIYAWYLHEQWDLYKYSPSFSVLFAPLAYLPDIVGLIVWNSLNSFAVLLGIKWMPQVSQSNKIKILLFVLIELLTSMQNSQSNGLVAGLIMIGFCCLERGHFFLGILLIVFTAFIKIFGVLALGLLIFYPDKLKLIAFTLISFALYFFLPLVVVDVGQLMLQYNNWWALLKADHAVSMGLSVSGWLTTWFGFSPNKTYLLIVGLLLLGLPLLWWKRYSNYSYRLTLLSGLLIWLVIFNHKAESPTFIIAACGAIIWYLLKPRGTVDLVLIVLVFVFTILSSTDVFPNYIRDNFFNPYVIKAVPCIMVWVRIVVEGLFWRNPQDMIIQ